MEQCPAGVEAKLIQADPLFVNPGEANYRLRRDSPAIDAGDPLGAPDLDFDGQPRIRDGDRDGRPVIDLGAYETKPPRLAPARSRSRQNSR